MDSQGNRRVKSYRKLGFWGIFIGLGIVWWFLRPEAFAQMTNHGYRLTYYGVYVTVRDILFVLFIIYELIILQRTLNQFFIFLRQKREKESPHALNSRTNLQRS